MRLRNEYIRFSQPDADELLFAFDVIVDPEFVAISDAVEHMNVSSFRGGVQVRNLELSLFTCDQVQTISAAMRSWLSHSSSPGFALTSTVWGCS